MKRKLICGIAHNGGTLIDLACGKAGDLPKWIYAKLAFVFGVDISRDNIENRKDGACARYLTKRRRRNNENPITDHPDLGTSLAFKRSLRVPRGGEG